MSEVVDIISLVIAIIGIIFSGIALKPLFDISDIKNKKLMFDSLYTEAKHLDKHIIIKPPKIVNESRYITMQYFKIDDISPQILNEWILRFIHSYKNLLTFYPLDNSYLYALKREGFREYGGIGEQLIANTFAEEVKKYAEFNGYKKVKVI